MGRHTNSSTTKTKDVDTGARGILSDSEIISCCRAHLLITESFDRQQLDGCSYEFRVGHIAYAYDYPSKKTVRYEGPEHVINPFATITVVTMEKVNLDNHHFLMLVSKGSLFSLGLSAVCTAADPGFRGHLGITLTNLSPRPILLKQGSGLVKGVFFHLTTGAAIHYVGQHGDATMSWPYPSHYHTEPADFKSMDASCWGFLPPPVLEAFHKLEYVRVYMRWIVIAFASVVVLDVLTPISRLWLTASAYQAIERYLGLLGALASIIGLLMSLALATRGQRN